MKKYQNPVLIFINILFFSLTIFMIFKVETLSDKYETFKSATIKMHFNKKPTESEIKEWNFKEDSYIRQQERETTLILVVFVGLLGLTSFFTYNSLIQKFKTYTEAIEDKFNNNSSNWEKQNFQLLKIENDLNFEAGYIKDAEARKYLEKKEFINYLFYTLFRCHLHAKCIDYYKNIIDDKEIAESLTNSIISSLQKLDNNIVKIELEKNEDAKYMGYINSINKVNNPEIFKLTSNIFSKLDFSK